MKTNNKINKNKTKIESIESINRGRKEVESGEAMEPPSETDTQSSW